MQLVLDDELGRAARRPQTEDPSRGCLPWQRSKLVCSRNHQRGATGIQLFVYEHDRQAVGEAALPVARLPGRASDTELPRVGVDVVVVRGHPAAAPGATVDLYWIALDDFLAVPHSVQSLPCVREVIRRAAASDPESDEERVVAELRVVGPYGLAAADQKRGTLELLDSQQAQRVAHKDADAVAGLV